MRRSHGREASFAFVRQVDVVPYMCSHAFTMDVVEVLVKKIGAFRLKKICIVCALCAEFRAVMEVLMSLRRNDMSRVKYLRAMVSRHLVQEALLQGPREMQVTTLEGEPLTFKVFPTDTLKDLKAMLVAHKHREDLTKRKLCCVKVLAGGLLVDDDQTLESAGLMCDVT